MQNLAHELFDTVHQLHERLSNQEDKAVDFVVHGVVRRQIQPLKLIWGTSRGVARAASAVREEAERTLARLNLA